MPENNTNSEHSLDRSVVTEIKSKKDSDVQDMLTRAAEIYHANLTPEIRKLINEKWGISDETIDEIKIGYAKQFAPNNPTLPHGTSLLHLVGSEFDLEALAKTGLLIKLGESYTEIFVGRIVFPYWIDGKVADFEAIGDNVIGTPQTEFEASKYKKLLAHSEKHPYVSERVNSRYLPGEDRIIKQDYCISAESIKETIYLLQKGYPVLSPLTVQFAAKNIEKLISVTKTPKIVYVYNNSGKGTLKTATKLRALGINTKIITLPIPDGKDRIDIAEYFSTRAKEDFDKVLANAAHLSDYLLAKYDIPQKAIEKIETAKLFVDDFLKYLPLDIASPIIDHDVRDHFQLNKNDCRLIYNYYKRNMTSDGDVSTEKLSFNKSDDAGFAIKVLSEEFIAKYKPCISIGKALYVYDGGVYCTGEQVREQARVFVRDIAFEFHGVAVSTENAERVLKAVCDVKSIKASQINNRPELLVVANGILDVKTGELHPHNKDEYHTVKVDVVYEPSMPIADMFKVYLKSTFAGVEWEIPILQEMLGYCLYKGYSIEKFFFLIGDGENGKSVLINLISAFLGYRNVTAMTIHEICKPQDKHSLIKLFGKLANVCGETGDEEINDMGNLKRVTGRDMIRSRELYCDWIEFHNHAKMIFSMNKPPVINDGTTGKKRRQIFLDFPNKFTEGINAISGLEDKLSTPESLTGILNWALEGLSRLLKNGKFSDQRTRAEIEIAYERKSNPIRYFVQDHILEDIDHGSRVYESLIYDAYLRYANRNGLPTLKQKEIRQKLIKECASIGILVNYRQSKQPPRPRYFVGIKLCDLETVCYDMKTQSSAEAAAASCTDTVDNWW